MIIALRSRHTSALMHPPSLPINFGSLANFRMGGTTERKTLASDTSESVEICLKPKSAGHKTN